MGEIMTSDEIVTVRPETPLREMAKMIVGPQGWIRPGP